MKAAIQEVRQAPFTSKRVLKLHGPEITDEWRIRVDPWRIIFRVDEDSGYIELLDMDDRKRIFLNDRWRSA